MKNSKNIMTSSIMLGLNFILIFSLLQMSCAINKSNLELKKFDKQALLPPDMISLNDSLYCQMVELSTTEYKSFLSWKNKFSNSVKTTNAYLYPDQSGHVFILDSIAGNDSIVIMSRYFKDKNYSWYPIINVTLNQAKEYCRWKSVQQILLTHLQNKVIDYEEYSRSMKKNYTLTKAIDKFTNGKRFSYLTHYPLYFIPNADNWDVLIRNIHSKKIKIGKVHSLEHAKRQQQKGGIPISSFLQMKNLTIADVNVDIHHKQKNPMVCLNILGNVSELLSDGRTAGGNYTETTEEILKLDYKNEPVPSPLVGFRCFFKWVKIERE